MKILMVCLGNICRSPLAHGILQSRIDSLGLSWEVDSCGTGSWHSGQSPDPRSIAIAKTHGIDISSQKARQITKFDVENYDLIVAMDAQNYNNILRLSNNSHKSKVELLLNFGYPGENRAVPDPYYDGGFDTVFEMISYSCDQLIEKYHKIEVD